MGLCPWRDALGDQSPQRLEDMPLFVRERLAPDDSLE
jgi:hypothetical protein